MSPIVRTAKAGSSSKQYPQLLIPQNGACAGSLENVKETLVRTGFPVFHPRMPTHPAPVRVVADRPQPARAPMGAEIQSCGGVESGDFFCRGGGRTPCFTSSQGVRDAGYFPSGCRKGTACVRDVEAFACSMSTVSSGSRKPSSPSFRNSAASPPRPAFARKMP